MAIVETDPSEPEANLQVVLQPEELKFLTICAWMRKYHAIAFILGLFSFGIPYAMAGIAGALPDDDVPSLTSYWTKKKLKWIATLAVLGEAFFLGSWFFGALRVQPAVLLALPIVLAIALGILEILYEIYKNSDGFVVTQEHTFRSTACRHRAEGPARLASDLIGGLPEKARPCFGLMWAWILGSVYVATFFAGVALVMMIGYCLVAFMIVAFVIGMFSDQKYIPPPPDPLPDVPPIPADGYGAVDARGAIVVHRFEGTLFCGNRRVGQHRGNRVFLYRSRSGTSVEAYRLSGNEIEDVLEGGLYGSFDSGGIYSPSGELMYSLVEVSN